LKCSDYTEICGFKLKDSVSETTSSQLYYFQLYGQMKFVGRVYINKYNLPSRYLYTVIYGRRGNKYAHFVDL
jgi:hypothetical protein